MVVVQDSRTASFLNALQGSTQNTYRISLKKCEAYLRTLPEYANAIDPLFAFIIDVKKDRALDVVEMRYVERNVITGLFPFLKKQGYSNNTQLVDAAALQSFGNFSQVPLSTKFTKPPSNISASEKHEWTIEELGKFIEAMRSSRYQALATSALQSTLRLSDLVGENFVYGKIQKEFEEGVSPVCIQVRSSEKTEVEHRTFLGKLAVSKLKVYFEEFGVPKLDEPIFPVSKRSVDAVFLSHALNLYPKWVGQNPYCIHSIRAAACTFLQDAHCPESVIEYFSGHGLGSDVKLRYRKRSTDRWRQFYKNFEWALDYTLKQEDMPKTSVSEFKRLVESLLSEDEA